MTPPTAPSPCLGEREAVAAEPPLHPAPPPPIPVRDRYFLVECGNCAWVGSSEQLGGSGYDGDIWCPVCCDSLLDDGTDYTAAAKHGEAVYQRILTAETERDAAIARAEEERKVSADLNKAATVATCLMIEAVAESANLRREYEMLTAKLAQAEGEIATSQEALRLAEGPLSWLARDLHGSAVVARALAAVRAALTTPEHPHGD